MPRRKPYTKTKLAGDILALVLTGGGWLLWRMPWELYQWAGSK